MSKKKWLIVVASILVVVAIGLGVGLGVGLKEKRNEIIELYNWSPIASYRPNAIILKYSDERVVFECNVDNGCFFIEGSYIRPEEYVKIPIIAEVGNVLLWSDYDMGTKKHIKVDLAYANFILKLGDKIIGYAVIKITPMDSGYVGYNAEILKSEVFKNWLGLYKGVSEEYVTSLIEQLKAEN